MILSSWPHPAGACRSQWNGLQISRPIPDVKRLGRGPLNQRPWSSAGKLLDWQLWVGREVLPQEVQVSQGLVDAWGQDGMTFIGCLYSDWFSLSCIPRRRCLSLCVISLPLHPKKMVREDGCPPESRCARGISPLRVFFLATLALWVSQILFSSLSGSVGFSTIPPRHFELYSWSLIDLTCFFVHAFIVQQPPTWLMHCVLI